jgi:hypothetical protein
MTKYIDLTGQRFGRLTVIEYNGSNKFGGSTWLCKCDCGNETIAASTNLKRKETHSCGCYFNDTLRGAKGESNSHRVFLSYKNKAKKRNLNFEISEDEFRKITKENCFYCGEEPSSIEKGENHYGIYVYNGIDRVDNSKGYITGNIVPCCGNCNFAKRKMNVPEFYKWIRKVYNYSVLLNKIS